MRYPNTFAASIVSYPTVAAVALFGLWAGALTALLVLGGIAWMAFR